MENWETHMLRTVFAIGIAGLIFAGGSGTTQAAPILPLPVAATAGLDNLTDVQWGATLLACTAGVTAGAIGTAGGNSNLVT